MKITRGCLAVVAGVLSSIAVARGQAAAPVSINLDAADTSAKVSPTLYGLMTEEINYSYDGGLYGELIRNRVFKGSEYGRPRAGAAGAAAAAPEPNDLSHWSVAKYNGGDAAISIDKTQPLNTALDVSLLFDASALKPGQRAGISNDGYWGIPVEPNTTYRASFYAKTDPGFNGPLTVAIESNDGATAIASADVPHVSGDWKQYTVTLKTGDVKESAANHFVISAGAPGKIWFQLVSLFPPTFNNRPNGNRVDLMQKLVDMKPKFLRFPGGNYLEGNDLPNYFDWKKTVGPLDQRPTHLSPWNYRSSDGMGLLEFLEWTEDMHAEPVLAVFAGYTLNHENIATGAPLQPYVQEALDEIEYVTGDASTKFGAERIADGHPAAFPLHYVEIGNEDNFDMRNTNGHVGNYDGRYAQFYDAIKAKYPSLMLIATTPVKGHVFDVIDEHSYFRSAELSERDAHRFDKRDRNGPKVFMGEWATRVGSPTTNLLGALGDAAFMTGLERNSDLVKISCYAPLFVNVNPGGMQWASDLIGYDALSSYGSPSYYVQKMFSDNLGDVIVPETIENVPTIPYTTPAARGAATRPATPLETLFTCCTRDSSTGEIYLKVVNTSENAQPVQINIKGVKSVNPDGKVVTLTSANTSDTNSITDPTKIVPVQTSEKIFAPSFNRSFAPHSVTILALQGE
jgi:alpha-N-arabinofuranosidase